ncbi:hypothetical protein [Xylophilus sp. Leaf220]|uniref:hypothetical protein n=1 Tax=Xylophilus sp. Leaf220 TaxID=1735686 RepID=UPI0006F7D9F0|nr:hypothetical protein [Xylophilus sp. Leaf220]KQM80270.1 hypothetical protein ASE76_03760 [Xylophilus sp. Leaf220]
MHAFFRWTTRAATACLLLATLAGCDPQRIESLEEGVATEADVRRAFGEPERIWPEADGARTFEYNRQPAGLRNYMITVGTDGRMRALRQVLTPANFARLQPGMPALEVRRLLGRPMQETPFSRTAETVWEWRYLAPPNTSMVFSATFGADGRLLRTGSQVDPQSEAQRAG